MTMTDPLADMLTRIRNGQQAKHRSVTIPASNIKRSVAKILKEEGYIDDYSCIRDDKQGLIKIRLKYTDGKKGVITAIKRVSRPGIRRYVGKDEIPSVLGGLGVAILTTSRGVMTDRRARELGVGGEVLCIVY
ncbi:MAG TPA: 30S ribosomal protein S8 [Deltaproteobacteria bacterium]|nr:30S ribosomal protein S8 [Deltaproteobacteria bacterium]